MNERIKELAEQAGFVEGRFSESGDNCELKIKKLIELTVRECLQEIKYLLVDDKELFADEETRDHVNEGLLDARTNISYAFGIPDDGLRDLYFPDPSESKE